jgi:hypothetical protein
LHNGRVNPTNDLGESLSSRFPRSLFRYLPPRPSSSPSQYPLKRTSSVCRFIVLTRLVTCDTQCGHPPLLPRALLSAAFGFSRGSCSAVSLIRFSRTRIVHWELLIISFVVFILIEYRRFSGILFNILGIFFFFLYFIVCRPLCSLFFNTFNTDRRM